MAQHGRVAAARQPDHRARCDRRAARKLSGEDAEELPVPAPGKPDYSATAPGSLRQIDDQPKFQVGDRGPRRAVRPGGVPPPRYVRGGPVWCSGSSRPRCYPTRARTSSAERSARLLRALDSAELWGPDAERFDLSICTLCSCYPWQVLGLPPGWYTGSTCHQLSGWSHQPDETALATLNYMPYQRIDR